MHQNTLAKMTIGRTLFNALRMGVFSGVLGVVGCASTPEKNEPAVKEVRGGADVGEEGLEAKTQKTAQKTAGVEFIKGDFSSALQKAQAQKQNLMVEVWAVWCPPCRAQKAEVFDVGEGVLLTRNLVAWQMDFDKKENRSLVEKWRVLNLPTVLFLRSDGTEIGRIEGYEEKESFLAQAEIFALGKDDMPKWQALLTKKKDAGFAEKAKPMLEVGHRLLVRGENKGEALLKEVVAGDQKHKSEEAQQALFLLGRYYSRVQQDFVTGKKTWRKLHDDYPTGEFAATAAWWTAGAMLELKEADAALSFLIERNTENMTAKDVDLVMSFVEKSKTGIERARAFLAAVDAKSITDAQREGWEQMLASIDGAQPVEP